MSFGKNLDLKSHKIYDKNSNSNTNVISNLFIIIDTFFKKERGKQICEVFWQ
jgi:hypothetical protein